MACKLDRVGATARLRCEPEGDGIDREVSACEVAFDAWQEGYGAFTAANADKDRLIEYIVNQEAHHKTESFLDEYRRLLNEAGIKFDEKYLA